MQQLDPLAQILLISNLALYIVCSRALDIFLGVGPVEGLEGIAAKEPVICEGRAISSLSLLKFFLK